MRCESRLTITISSILQGIAVYCLKQTTPHTRFYSLCNKSCFGAKRCSKFATFRLLHTLFYMHCKLFCVLMATSCYTSKGYRVSIVIFYCLTFYNKHKTRWAGRRCPSFENGVVHPIFLISKYKSAVKTKEPVFFLPLSAGQSRFFTFFSRVPPNFKNIPVFFPKYKRFE